MGEIHKKKGFIVIFALSLFGYKKKLCLVLFLPM